MAMPTRPAALNALGVATVYELPSPACCGSIMGVGLVCRSVSHDIAVDPSVSVSAAVVWDGVGVSGVWAPVLVGSGAVVGLAANMGAAMMARVVWGIPPVLLAWVFWYGLVLWAIAL